MWWVQLSLPTHVADCCSKARTVLSAFLPAKLRQGWMRSNHQWPGGALRSYSIYSLFWLHLQANTEFFGRTAGMRLRLVVVQSQSFWCSEMTMLRCRLGRTPQGVTASAKNRWALLRDTFGIFWFCLLGFALFRWYFPLNQKFCNERILRKSVSVNLLMFSKPWRPNINHKDKEAETCQAPQRRNFKCWDVHA